MYISDWEVQFSLSLTRGKPEAKRIGLLATAPSKLGSSWAVHSMLRIKVYELIELTAENMTDRKMAQSDFKSWNMDEFWKLMGPQSKIHGKWGIWKYQ